MTFWDGLLTAGILFALFILAYCKLTEKTLIDFLREIKDFFSPPIEETPI